MKKKIIEFLEGKYSLGHSYWVVGILGSIGVGIPLFILLASGFDEIGSFEAFLVIAYYIFYLTYCIGTSIGIWKSAGNYIHKNIKAKLSPFWGYAARVAVVLGAVSLLNEILKLFR
jgi:hypothetical protein